MYIGQIISDDFHSNDAERLIIDNKGTVTNTYRLIDGHRFIEFETTRKNEYVEIIKALSKISNYSKEDDLKLEIFSNPKQNNANKIYTMDIAYAIVELFEDILDKNGIKIPSSEDDERDKDNDAALYGLLYYNLVSDVEEIILETLESKSDETSLIPYIFSGHK